MTASAVFRCLLLALCCTSGAFAQALPAGWTAREVPGGVLYRDGTLPSGHELSLLAAAVDVGKATGPAAFDQARAVARSASATQCQAPAEQSGSVTQQCSADGGRTEVTYMMLPVRGSTAHPMRVTVQGDRAALEPRKPGIVAVMQAQTARWKAGTGGQPASAEAPKPAPAPPAKPDARAAIAQAVRTEPGRGIPDADVAGVLVAWTHEYRIGGMQYDETVYLLLKDGTAYVNPWLPPGDLDVAASRRLQPGRWVEWRERGGDHQVRSNPQASWRTLQATRGIRAGRDDRLSKKYTHSSFANHGGLGGWAQQDSFRFDTDGRYEEGRYRTQGTGAVQAGNGYTGGGSSGRSGQGSWSSTSGSQTGGNGTVATGSTTTRNDGSPYRGAYRIDGWTIEFLIDNGKRTRQLFFFSQKDRSGINVGGTWYLAK